MKLTIPQTTLCNALKAAALALPSKPLVPMFGGFLIKSYGNLVEVTCTDDIKRVESLIHGVGDGEKFATVVSGKALLDWVSKLPKDKDIGLTFEGNTMTAKCGKSRCVFATMSAEDYPTRGNQKPLSEFAIKCEELHSALRSVLFAVADMSESKQILQGVNLSIDNGELVSVGLDGFRLAVKHSTIEPDREAEPFNVTIPATFAKTLLTLLPTNGTAMVEVTSGMMTVNILNSVSREDIFITTRLLKGEYINYKGILPKQNGNIDLTVDKTEMLSALSRVMLAAGGSNKLIVLASGEYDHAVSISARDTTMQASEELRAEDNNHPDMDAGFNGAYLSQALNAYDDEPQGGLVTVTLINNGMQMVLDDGRLYQLILGVRRRG